MERGEPALVPEWLKKTGTVSGSSTSHSDEQNSSDLMKHKSSVLGNGDSGGSFNSLKTTSPYFHRSSSSSCSSRLRSCSSFGTNRRAREYDKDIHDLNDKNKSVSGDHRRRDSLDGRRNSVFKRNGLQHSQPMVSGKTGDNWHKKVTNGLSSKGNSVHQASKVTFERDFPSLGIDERAVIPEVGRVPSPGLTSAIQSLPINSLAITSDETLTSVLAEVPVLVGGTATGRLSTQQVAPSSVTSVALGTPSNLNMAEAVAQGTKHAQITPQLSVETQRLEELAIKQSRQLIPVRPSLPKTLVSNSLDKQKAKVGQQQHPTSSSFAVNHSLRTNGLVKSDIAKPSNMGKLHVLKPVREKNGAMSVVKDNLHLRSVGKPVSSTLAAASVPVSAPTCVAGNVPAHESKPAMNPLEKRPSSQAQSRNDFFNLVRKKSMANSSSIADSSIINSSDSGISTAASASVSHNVAEMEVVNAPNTSQDGDIPHHVNPSGNPSTEMACMGVNDDTHAGRNHVKTGNKLPISDPIFSEEEEAAFLRSLGWEENGEEGGLTEEEINAFFRDVTKYLNSNPTLKIRQGVHPKFLSPFNSHIMGVAGIPSTDAKLES